MTIVLPRSREAADRQAEQNRQMAKLHQEVASGTHELVAADALARQEVFQVHRDLEVERHELDASRDALEQERQRIAGERRTESLLVPAFEATGMVAVVVVLLGFSWYALAKTRADEPDDSELSELLIHELAATGPLGLPGPSLPARIPSGTKPRITGSGPPERSVLPN